MPRRPVCFWSSAAALDKNGVQPGKTFERIGGHSGQILEPKRVLLKVAIISRPFGDPAINEVVWKAADEQVIPSKDRHAWEVNGLRIGRIIGELPLELEAIMNDTNSNHKVTPTNFFIENGEPTLIKISDPVEHASLFLNRDNRAFGNDYEDVSGYFRVTAQHEGSNNVSLRLVPEFHHGPVTRTFQAVPIASAIGAQQFQINNGQEEEVIRELSTGLILQPGQVAVLGCRHDKKRGLGTFFFTQSVASNEQRLEKLILIWASRNMQGVGPDDRTAKQKDRTPLFKRLVGPPEPPPQTPRRPGHSMPASPGVDITPPVPDSSSGPMPATTTPPPAPFPPSARTAADAASTGP